MKNGNKEVLSSIISLLEKDEQNIREVATNLDIQWPTAKKYLERLENIKVLKSRLNGRETVFSINTASKLKTDDETVLRIPLTENVKQRTRDLASKVKFAWSKSYKKTLPKTTLVKIMIEVIITQKLDIPYGWYLYGPCTSYIDFEVSQLPEQESDDTDIITAVATYGELDSTKDVRRHFYREHAREDYQLSLSIMDTLGNDDINCSVFRSQLESLIFSIKKTQDNTELLEVLDAYYAYVGRLLRKHEELVSENRVLLQQSFIAIWNLIGTYNYCESLVSNSFNEKSRIEPYYDLQFDTLVQQTDPLLFELRDLANS